MSSPHGCFIATPRGCTWAAFSSVVDGGCNGITGAIACQLWFISNVATVVEAFVVCHTGDSTGWLLTFRVLKWEEPLSEALLPRWISILTVFTYPYNSRNVNSTVLRPSRDCGPHCNSELTCLAHQQTQRQRSSSGAQQTGKTSSLL